MIEHKPQPKGKKFLIEVELVKEMDIYDTFIMKSLYGKDREEGINGEFKVNVLYNQTMSEVREKIKEQAIKVIDEGLRNI